MVHPGYGEQPEIVELRKGAVALRLYCGHRDRNRSVSRALPLIAELPSGWGPDPVWTRLTADNRRKSAILDQLPVKHTRPFGQVLLAALNAAGRNAAIDLDEMRRRFGRLRLYPRSRGQRSCLDRPPRHRLADGDGSPYGAQIQHLQATPFR